MALFSSEGDFEEQWLLALMCRMIPMRLSRLQVIQSAYPSLFQACDDNFLAVDSDAYPWIAKLQGSQWVSKYHHLRDQCAAADIQIITIFDDNFAQHFSAMRHQPLVLYFQGNIQALQHTAEMITVVGSRNFSRYSELVMKQILEPACQQGLGVVSGLAMGIDGLSHQIAVQAHAATIAVIGSGLDTDSFYPVQHQGLKQSIIESGGLVLSEYAPGMQATKYTFPQRNRLLAALTPLTWVVQAGHKSGTLITAREAQDAGKLVAATPSSILEKSMQGSIQLLKDGAHIVTSAEDIFGLLGLQSHTSIQPEQVVEFSSSAEKMVYQNLSLTPQLADEIAIKAGLEIFELSTHLTILEIQGLAVNIGQNLWVKGVR